MAAKGNSYAEKISRWELLVTNAKVGAADMPHITDDVASLEGLVSRARGIESQQASLRSQAQELSTQLQTLAKGGDVVRRRIGANLNGKFGFTSETLVMFGFKPRKPNRRPARAEKAPKKTVEAQAAATPAAGEAGHAQP